MMIRAVAGLLLWVATGIATAAAVDAVPGLVLDGKWQQGAVLIGQAPVGARVWFDGRELRVTDAGRFVFGLHRDASGPAELKLQLPGRAEPYVIRHAIETREYKIQRIDGLPQKMVTPPAEVLERIRADQALVRKARDHDSALEGFAEPFEWPCTGRISGVFGSQRILNGEPRQPHYGVDVAVPVGTEVRAPAGGVVTLAHPDMYYTGATLMIDHGHGLSSAFLHLSKLLVEEGQVVERGQPIALSGMSGRATGPHLDWRVNWFDARVDAQLLVPPMPGQASPSTP